MRKTLTHTARNPRRQIAAFTLIEALAGLILLGILFTMVFTSYEKTMDGVTNQIIEERGIAVCQRHMENLLATLQEPNSINLPTQDEIDPFFNWELDLRRITMNDAAPNPEYTNTLIVATITARYDAMEDELAQGRADPIELVRFLPWNGLKPMPGRAIAVPVTHEYEEPEWLLELKKKTGGRDPTVEEIIQHLFPEMEEELIPDAGMDEPEEEDLE